MERVKSEDKEKVMEAIRKAGDADNYETSWDDKGGMKSKSKVEIKRGKKSKSKGGVFELKVRKDLESKGYTISKWSNNVDLENKEIIIAKRKYNPFNKALTIGTGFPDFVAIKHIYDESYSVIGVEVKLRGLLSKEEKEKCLFLLGKKVFSRIWIAKLGEKRGEIEYVDFKDKYKTEQ